MNKLFTKIAASVLGLSMATGVGVAAGSQIGAAARTEAATSANWTQHTGAITAGEYLIVDVGSTKCMAPTGGAVANGGYSQVAFTASSAPSNGFTLVASSSNWKITDQTSATTYYVYASGTTNNGLRNGTSSSQAGSTWTISETSNGSGEYTIISETSRQISAYQTSNWRSYGTTSGAKTNVKLYEKSATPQTITVDPSSKEAYTDETISLTTSATSASWALSNNTCGASLSAASGQTVTVSATGAGSVRVTATASGYTSPYVDLTFSERPTSPYITPEKNSTSGYTGQNETISFTYGNLTGSLSITSSNTSVVTVGTPSYSAGEGTVQFNFVGAGSTTVKFYDGSTELASVSVSVTASSVTITGLAASGSVYTGKTLDLGSTITVTATGSYSNAVTWTSSVPANATVDSSGVVTGVKEGSTIITVASVDYPSATMSCTVTVSEIASYELVTDVSKLADGTQFVLVDYVSSTYRIAKDLNSGHIKMNTVTSKTEVSGTSSGDTVVTEEADVFTLVGSAGSWEIKRGDTYLQFTGTSNGNDSFTDTSSADTKFSISASSTTNKVTIASNSRTNRVLRYNTSTGDLRNYASTGSQPDLYMYAIIPAQNELDSISITGQTTSFSSGATFSFGGTVTAHYTLEADANVTNSATFHLDSESGSNMSGVTLTHAAHDGHTIYVVYTEGGITKSATYTITVSNAPVTSVTINVHAAEIGLGELYSTSSITKTVLPADAVQTTEWVVASNTVGDDYLWDGTDLMSVGTEGTVTLRCRSTADNTKYDDLVVTITGDPTAAFVKESTTGYAGKTEEIAFTYGNIDDESKIVVASSNTSYVTVANDLVADQGEGLVTINFVAAGSANVTISYDGGETLDTLAVTVSADSVTSVTWSEPSIDVYSGATLSTTGWNVQYEMASGDSGSADSYTIKLGSTTVTAGYTFQGSDDGKTLHVEYGGVSSSSVIINVTQTINNVYASVSEAWDFTFESKAWTAAGDHTLDDKVWNMSGTDDGSPFFGYDATKGQQFGSGSHPFSDVSLQSSAFSGTIDSVTVYTSGANSINATVQVSVGGTAYGSAETITNTNTAYKFDLGGKSGTISIDWVNSSSKAIYIKEIVVNIVSGSTNIANVAAHKDAQRVAVKYANAFNAAMDETNGCTTGIAAAWSACSDAYDTFKSEAAALGSAEEAYAKNLIKYATAQYRDPESEDNGNDCIERMMKTYEIMVGRGQTEFMSELVSLSNNLPLSVVNNDNLIIVVTIIALVSITAVGGYFFLKKKKEQ